MIHHMSLAVRDPAALAPVLARLAGGLALRAPSPPFPHGTWFVCLGDAAGGLVELMPEDVVLDPDAPLGLGRREGPLPLSAAHVLLGTPLSHQEVLATAERQGWRAQEVESGLFRIVKIWVEGRVLIEFIAAAEARRYVAAFGPEGLPSLDDKLRTLERDLAEDLAARLPAGRLASILGTPTG